MNVRLVRTISGEKHHIKPRSLFPELAKDKSNIVKLTYREHYICHWLLTKIYPSKEMICAFWFMNQLNNAYRNSNAYRVNRSEYVKSFIENHPDLSGSKNGMYGKNVMNYMDENTKKHWLESRHYNTDVRKRISDKLKELWKDENYKANMIEKIRACPNKFFLSKEGKKLAELGRKKSHLLCQKKVRCIETGEVFESPFHTFLTHIKLYFLDCSLNLALTASERYLSNRISIFSISLA